jgi:hypothetical protein
VVISGQLVFYGGKTVLEELRNSIHEIVDLQKQLHDSAEALSNLTGKFKDYTYFVI